VYRVQTLVCLYQRVTEGQPEEPAPAKAGVELYTRTFCRGVSLGFFARVWPPASDHIVPLPELIEKLHNVILNHKLPG